MEISYCCEKCREDKPAIQFSPRVESGVIVRNDTCNRCLWGIDDCRRQRQPRRREARAANGVTSVMR